MNFRVRLFCIILGITLLIVALSSIISYRNGKVFCGFILLLSGLHKKGETPWLLRLQVGIVYFGSGLNKLFEPDWLSGQYFEHWMHHIMTHPKYILMASWLRPMTLSKTTSWLSIVIEFFICFGLFSRRYFILAAWTGILFHLGSILLTWTDFGIFGAAILSSYLVFIQWPDKININYNARTKHHNLLKKIFRSIDFDDRFIWEADSTKKLSVKINQNFYTGFIALKKCILYSPIFYLLIILILGGKALYLNTFQIRMIEILLIFFLPIPELWKHFRSKK